jgi:hypothetical protein
MIELYRLSNMTFWRGQVAREVSRCGKARAKDVGRRYPQQSGLVVGFADFGDNGSKGTRQEKNSQDSWKRNFSPNGAGSVRKSAGGAGLFKSSKYDACPVYALFGDRVCAFGTGHVKFLHIIPMGGKTAATLALPASSRFHPHHRHSAPELRYS